MSLAELTWSFPQIPFRQKFSHQSAERTQTESIFVRVRLTSGHFGYGEGCPRSYVTGESRQSCDSFLTQRKENFIRIQNLIELQKLAQEMSEDILKNPSAWCALEMAFLDAFARQQNQSVEALLGLKPLQEPPPCTAVLGLDSWSGFLGKALRYRLAGFRDFKVKISSDKAGWTQQLQLLRGLGVPAARIRLDANNLWQNAKQAEADLRPWRADFFALEEPLQAGDLEGSLRLAQALERIVILDESFRGLENLPDSKFLLPNLRLSKLGGICRSLNLMHKLAAGNFQFILGSHVGESSLLTRAALALVAPFSAHLAAYEGGFSDRLLKYDPFAPALRVGFRGRLSHLSEVKNKVGWGLEPQGVEW